MGFLNWMAGRYYVKDAERMSAAAFSMPLNTLRTVVLHLVSQMKRTLDAEPRGPSALAFAVREVFQEASRDRQMAVAQRTTQRINPAWCSPGLHARPHSSTCIRPCGCRDVRSHSQYTVTRRVSQRYRCKALNLRYGAVLRTARSWVQRVCRRVGGSKAILSSHPFRCSSGAGSSGACPRLFAGERRVTNWGTYWVTFTYSIR